MGAEMCIRDRFGRVGGRRLCPDFPPRLDSADKYTGVGDAVGLFQDVSWQILRSAWSNDWSGSSLSDHRGADRYQPAGVLLPARSQLEVPWRHTPAHSAPIPLAQACRKAVAPHSADSGSCQAGTNQPRHASLARGWSGQRQKPVTRRPGTGEVMADPADASREVGAVGRQASSGQPGQPLFPSPGRVTV